MDPIAPKSLLKHDPPLFVGEEGVPSQQQKKTDSKATAQLTDIVNSILPPRGWNDESGNWMQYTSTEPSTRLDVINIQEAMDAELIKRQARDSGICPVREDVYSQCFDEIIRQVTINTPERGLLLLRIRDEIRMTIDAHKILYDSSVTFGVRKQLQAEQGMGSLEEEIAKLEKEKKESENRVLELTNEVDVIEKRANERRALVEKKRKDEIDFLKYQGQHLDVFLKSVNSNK